MKKIIWFLSIFLMAIPINCKMSKAMKSFQEGQEEPVEKKKPKIDFLELQKRLEGKLKSTRKNTFCEQTENFENIFKSYFTSKNDKLWVKDN